MSRRMVEREIIKSENQDIYRWGIRSGFIIILNILTSLLIGLITGKQLAVMAFAPAFLLLRSYAGGFHSESKVFCYISSSLILFIPVYTVNWFLDRDLNSIIFFSIAAIVIIFLLCPMDSKNRILDDAEKKHFGNRAKILSVFCLF